DRKGRWLVLGLLGKDDGSDHGTDSQNIAEMPKNAGLGIIWPGRQIHDLARVARSFDDVDVFAAYADPRGLILGSRFGMTWGKQRTEPAPREAPDPPPRRGHDDDEDPNWDVGAGRQPDLPIVGPRDRRRPQASRERRIPPEIASVKFIRNNEILFPAPLEKVR